MNLLSYSHPHIPKNPLFCGVLANTILSTVPGLSGAGPDPQGSLLVPNLDAELIIQGRITSCDATPNTGTGCPTPASITRSMAELAGFPIVFVNAGLENPPLIPSLDVRGSPGKDPRIEAAVPKADELFSQGKWIGHFFSKVCDTLVIGECVPGGTTTALCVLRAQGYDAYVSSAAVKSPTQLKEDIVHSVLSRLENIEITSPMQIIREAGDPMMAVTAGIVAGYTGKVYLAGGTQMLAVASIIAALGLNIPDVVTTVYVRDDPTANSSDLAKKIGASIIYVDPDFGNIGHSGLVRYCIGEVKEGMGAGGAMFLANQMGYPLPEIKKAILRFVTSYCPSKPL